MLRKFPISKDFAISWLSREIWGSPWCLGFLLREKKHSRGYVTRSSRGEFGIRVAKCAVRISRVLCEVASWWISQRGLGLMGRNKMADGLRRFKDQRTNPCLKESKASMKCLDENNYDKNKCAMYFEAYKECKKSWNERKAARRRQGLPPNDPEMQ